MPTPDLLRPSRRLAVVLVVVFCTLAVAGTVLTLRSLSGAGGLSLPADPDVRYGLIGAPTPVGADPADVEAGEGYVWVSGAADGSLTRIDPGDGSTVRYDIGGEPGQIAVGDGAVWVRNMGDRITRVDVATGAVSPPISGGGVPISGMAVGAGHVWLSHIGDGTVTRVDLRTLAVVGTPIAVGSEPRALELGPDALYVANTGDGSISRIDTTTAEVTGTAAAGSALGGMEIDDGVLYIAADGGIVPIPEATFRPGERYEYDGWSYFEVAAGTMWVVHDEDPAVRRFDAAGRQAIGEPVLGVGAEIGRARFAFDRLWMTVPEDGTLVALGPVQP